MSIDHDEIASRIAKRAMRTRIFNAIHGPVPEDLPDNLKQIAARLKADFTAPDAQLRMLSPDEYAVIQILMRNR